MKASDSVNSLTELNPSEVSDPSCFICLDTEGVDGEPLVDSKIVRNCGCKFSVHPACWNEWMKGKTDYDCPICRKDSMLRIKIPPNPVLAFDVPREPPSTFSIWCKGAATLICLTGGGLLVAAIVSWG